MNFALFFTPQKIFTIKEEPVRILAFGDIMLGRYVRVLMERNDDLYYPFKKTFGNKEWIGQFDLITANLEGPITERYITGGLSLTFGFPPDTAQILSNLGFDAVSLANNHTNNRGDAGYEETKKFLSEAGVGYYGHYKDVDLSPVYYKKVKGKKIAFIGLNDTFGKLDVDKALALIEREKPGVDYIIVFPHWGHEYQGVHDKRQEELAKKFIDAGADTVLGHHPHVVQDVGEYNGKKIFYSLGNYVFDQYFRQDVQEGLAIGITIENDEFKYEIYPMKSEASQPRFTPEPH